MDKSHRFKKILTMPGTIVGVGDTAQTLKLELTLNA